MGHITLVSCSLLLLLLSAISYFGVCVFKYIYLADHHKCPFWFSQTNWQFFGTLMMSSWELLMLPRSTFVSCGLMAAILKWRQR